MESILVCELVVVTGIYVTEPNVTEANDGNIIVTEPREIANIFDNFFTDIGPKLAKDLPEHNQIPETYVKPLNSIFQFQLVTETDVSKLLYILLKQLKLQDQTEYRLNYSKILLT